MDVISRAVQAWRRTLSVAVVLLLAACTTTPAEPPAPSPAPVIPAPTATPTVEAPATATPIPPRPTPAFPLIPPTPVPVPSAGQFDAYLDFQPTRPQVDFEYFDLEAFLAPNTIESIHPEYVVANSADESGLTPEDLVIGVSIEGESRAYPIRILRFREMVNDVLGGAPILVSW